MKDMVEKGNIQRPKVNHSGRKTFATTLLQGGKPITEVAQLGGWINIGSLMHYSVPSIKQQEEAPHTISSALIPDHNILSGVSDNRDNIESTVEIVDDMNQPVPFRVLPVTESNTCVNQKSNVASNKIKSEKEENPFSMFHRAIINGGTINVHIVTGSNKRKKHV